MEVFAENKSEAVQRLLVTVDGVHANIFLQERFSDRQWSNIISTVGWIGRNGLGKEAEGDGKTPLGGGRFLFGFGIMENPGTVFPYIKVNDGHYLVDDISSQYYNRIVSEEITKRDWSSAEHLTDMGRAYHYALVTDYNLSCERERGSGIFFHCEEGKPTAGCISVPEKAMKEIMQKIRRDCIWLVRAAFPAQTETVER